MSERIPPEIRPAPPPAPPRPFSAQELADLSPSNEPWTWLLIRSNELLGQLMAGSSSVRNSVSFGVRVRVERGLPCDALLTTEDWPRSGRCKPVSLPAQGPQERSQGAKARLDALGAQGPENDAGGSEELQ